MFKTIVVTGLLLLTASQSANALSMGEIESLNSELREQAEQQAQEEEKRKQMIHILKNIKFTQEEIAYIEYLANYVGDEERDYNLCISPKERDFLLHIAMKYESIRNVAAYYGVNIPIYDFNRSVSV